MNRFLVRMFLRNVDWYEHRLPWRPIGGSRSAAIFGVALWLSIVVITTLTVLLVGLRNSLPTFLRLQARPDWVYWALWIPVMFAFDRYVERLVHHYEKETSIAEIATKKAPGDTLYLALQWASILLMLIAIAEALSVR